MEQLISICIPAYKRTDFLKRLLDSIAIQTYKGFEVIVTDDSPDNEVNELVKGYQGKYELHYFRNPKQLGTPENWNEAIRNAKGQWIKLMHDDDWFSNADSLQCFADATKTDPDKAFVFSAYENVFLDENRQEPVHVNSFRYKLLKKNPKTLLSSNIIGPPSVTMYRKMPSLDYDKNLKWLVDIDFYISFLRTEKTNYVDKILVNVGMGAEQVTKESFRVPAVEIPENFYLLQKIGVAAFKNIFVYDAWWRLIRNLGVRNVADIKESGYVGEIPPLIGKMIRFQRRIPLAVLKIGPLSKFFMMISFGLYFNQIKAVG
jgi:glycosyltransferase involved in cell wall biosynthesis